MAATGVKKQNKRKDMDVKKLIMSNYEVNIPSAGVSVSDFTVKFHGPRETPYEGGIWTIQVILPAEYPYKSPAIGFCNRIFHPNVDERSGSVCLDVINQTWSPMFDLVNIFEVFLPQLLRYPNPSDPLNREAASMLLDNEESYRCRVCEYVSKYAIPSDIISKTPPQMMQGEGGDRLLQKEGVSNTTSSATTNSSNLSGDEKIGNTQHVADESYLMDVDDFDEYASDVSDMSDF